MKELICRPKKSGWTIRRLKHVADLSFSNVDKKIHENELPVQLCNYVDVYYNERITAELEFMLATATQSEIDRFQLRRGDVLITKDSESWDDIAVPALVDADLPGVACGYHLAMLRPKKAILHGAYLLRVLQASGIKEQFYTAATGVTRYGLSQQSIGNALVPLPPVKTQRAIANFLDQKTAAIDDLIAKKERLITLLEEKRAALINRAVTKGLNPDVPMKDSGIPWIGEIPAHWEVLQLRHVVRRFIDFRGRTPEKSSEGIPLITAGAIRDGAIDHSRTPGEWVSEETWHHLMMRGRPQPGDLLFTSEAPLGEVGLVTDTKIACAQRIILFRPNQQRTTSEFLRFSLLSEAGRGEILSRASGSTAEGIRADRLRMSQLVVPPLKEQEKIVAYLEDTLIHVPEMIDALRIQIEKLQEYRQALITAAVTGQIDVTQPEAVPA